MSEQQHQNVGARTAAVPRGGGNNKLKQARSYHNKLLITPIIFARSAPWLLGAARSVAVPVAAVIPATAL
jgi:hypothetical protein